MNQPLHILMIAGLAAGLVGCSQTEAISGKGGTELPSPIQIVVASDGSSSLAGMQWRLWSDSSSSGSSGTLLARGTATGDSSGSFAIPNQNGLWVLEGWKGDRPTRVTTRLRLSNAIPDSCIDSATRADSIRPSHECSNLQAPSDTEVSQLSIVRLSNGIDPLQLSLTSTSGNSLGLRSARLWTITDSDSLAFAGDLLPDSNGLMSIPHPAVTTSYLLEGWSRGTAPDTVTEIQAFSWSWASYLTCMASISLTSSTTAISVPVCSELSASPSVTDDSFATAPDIQAAFRITP